MKCGLGTAIILVVLLAGAPAPAEPSNTSDMASISEMVSDYLAGRFFEIESRAEALMASLPADLENDDDRLARADTLVKVGLAATLAEAFGHGGDLLGGARTLRDAVSGNDGDSRDPALVFVEAFYLHRSGRPVAAMARLGPVLDGGLSDSDDAMVWRAIMLALSANVRVALGEHQVASRLALEAWENISDRLGRDHPFATIARLWLIEALVAAGAPQAELQIESMFDDLQPRSQELAVVGILLTHHALGFASVEDIEPMTRLIFDRALATVRPDHTMVALGLEDIAYAAWWRGDYAGEMESLRQALDIYRKTLDPSAPTIGETIMPTFPI